MTAENQSRASSLSGMKGEIADADLNNVSGGDKATTAKTTTKPTTTITPLVIKLEQVYISSY